MAKLVTVTFVTLTHKLLPYLNWFRSLFNFHLKIKV